jgi:hypothetical protein
MYPEVASRLRPLAREYQEPLYLDLALQDRTTLEKFIGSYLNTEDTVMAFLDRNVEEYGGNFNVYTALQECAERVFNRCIVKILDSYTMPKGNREYFTGVLDSVCRRAHEHRPLQGNIVAMLLARGADPNSPRFSEESFYQVCSRGQLEAVQALVAGGLNVVERRFGPYGRSFGSMGLEAAWRNADTDMVRYLLTIPGVRI